MKWYAWVIIIALAVAVIVLLKITDNLTVENAVLESSLAPYLVDTPQTKGKVLTETNHPFAAIQSEEIKRNITRTVFVAEVEVSTAPITEEVPAVQVAEGEWSAETDWCSAFFRLPDATFTLTRKPQHVALEIAWGEAGELLVHSPADWFQVDEIVGVRASQRLTDFALGVEVGYPLRAVGTVRWGWFRGEGGYDFNADAWCAGAGVEFVIN